MTTPPVPPPPRHGIDIADLVPFRATRRYRTLREHNERRLAEQDRVREAVTSAQDTSAQDSEEVPF